jgi:hypothetical protein
LIRGGDHDDGGGDDCDAILKPRNLFGVVNGKVMPVLN